MSHRDVCEDYELSQQEYEESVEEREEAEVEVCFFCGSYFFFRGGRQICWRCRANGR